MNELLCELLNVHVISDVGEKVMFTDEALLFEPFPLS
jgi:hypothetical protein